MHWKRWLVLTVLAAAVIAAILYGFRPQPVLVETAPAKKGSLRVTVEEEGKTRITDRYVISAPVAGFARRISLKAGDPVRQGQTILQIEPLRAVVLDPRTKAQAEARLAAAEASVVAAEQRVTAIEADVAYWKGEMARVDKLLKTGDVARDRYDKTIAEERRSAASLREAQEQVRVARSEAAAARAALEYSGRADGAGSELTPVTAAVSGRVLRVVRESEGVVNPGEPLIEIANSRSLEVEVELLSADAVKIGPGTRVIFTRWGGEQPIEGRVRKVEPVGFTKVSALGVEEQRVPVIVDITTPAAAWARLGAGYRVEASFVLWESESVLQVPASALFRFEDGWALFVKDGEVARRKKVDVGRRTGLQAQINGGIEEGAVVIVHPDASVQDGTLIAERSAAKS